MQCRRWGMLVFAFSCAANAFAEVNQPVIAPSLDPISEALAAPTASHGPDLSLTKTANGSQTIEGTLIQYTLVVRNLDPRLTANKVVLTDALPSNVSYVSSTCPGNRVRNDFIVTWPTLAANSGQSCLIVVRATAAGTIVNRANVASGEADPVPGNNRAEVNVQADSATLPLANRLGISLLAGVLTLIAALWIGARRY